MPDRSPNIMSATRSVRSRSRERFRRAPVARPLPPGRAARRRNPRPRLRRRRADRPLSDRPRSRVTGVDSSSEDDRARPHALCRAIAGSRIDMRNAAMDRQIPRRRSPGTACSICSSDEQAAMIVAHRRLAGAAAARSCSTRGPPRGEAHRSPVPASMLYHASLTRGISRAVRQTRPGRDGVRSPRTPTGGATVWLARRPSEPSPAGERHWGPPGSLRTAPFRISPASGLDGSAYVRSPIRPAR